MRPWLLLLIACAPDPEVATGLSPGDQAIRASMALRGVRPTVAELAQVRAHPGSLGGLVDAWLADPAFGETVKDLHAETLWTRDDTQSSLPPIGPLTGATRGEIQASIAEAPLRLVETVVVSGRPYSEIVTTEDTLVDAVLAEVYGLPFDPAGPDWQVTTWADGRPSAGLLSDNGLWLRHISSDTNHHRARAATALRALLCDDLLGRDLGVLGLDLTDPDLVDDAVGTQPACTGCHELLDPVAASFSGYKRYILRAEVSGAYAAGCPDPDFCYPIGLYDPENAGHWRDLGLPAPALYGAAVADLADLGRAVAEHPEFARCTARRFAAYLGQVDPDDVDDDAIDALVGAYEESGEDARALARAVVTDPAFLSGPAQVVRPEQYARMLEDLTGFRWLVSPDAPGCEDRVPTCWGTVDLLNSDRFGFRLLAGGIDGYEVRSPLHQLTPTLALVYEQAAVEAAGRVVVEDLALPPAERRLLGLVERDTTDAAAVRAQIAALHERILGDAPTDASYALWSAALARHGQTEPAWKLLIAALLADVRAVTY